MKKGALEKEIKKLSAEETKELLLMTMYKLSMLRSQVDALTEMLVKKKVVSRENLWKETSERFEDQSL